VNINSQNGKMKVMRFKSLEKKETWLLIQKRNDTNICGRPHKEFLSSEG